MALSPGDVVMLKSGGLPMTVTSVVEDNVTCVWMSEDGVMFHDTLAIIALDQLELSEEDFDDEDEDEQEDDED